MRGEQAIFNLEIKKKSGLSLNPVIHHSKVFSSGHRRYNENSYLNLWKLKTGWKFRFNGFWNLTFLFKLSKICRLLVYEIKQW